MRASCRSDLHQASQHFRSPASPEVLNRRRTALTRAAPVCRSSAGGRHASEQPPGREPVHRRVKGAWPGASLALPSVPFRAAALYPCVSAMRIARGSGGLLGGVVQSARVVAPSPSPPRRRARAWRPRHLSSAVSRDRRGALGVVERKRCASRRGPRRNRSSPVPSAGCCARRAESSDLWSAHRRGLAPSVAATGGASKTAPPGARRAQLSQP